MERRCFACDGERAVMPAFGAYTGGLTEMMVVTVAPPSTLEIAGVCMLADLSGALFWQEQRLLVVSDLHLEKGSSFAMRGVLLPPYDTVATLGRLAAIIGATIRA